MIRDDLIEESKVKIKMEALSLLNHTNIENIYIIVSYNNNKKKYGNSSVGVLVFSIDNNNPAMIQVVICVSKSGFHFP